jgi:hypothetical protein
MLGTAIVMTGPGRQNLSYAPTYARKILYSPETSGKATF